MMSVLLRTITTLGQSAGRTIGTPGWACAGVRGRHLSNARAHGVPRLGALDWARNRPVRLPQAAPHPFQM
eukprot:7305481-Pyramimonas_sp.AAC.1